MSALPQLCLVPRTSEQWLSVDEVLAATGWSRATFYRRSGELVSREISGQREFLASSLPPSSSQAAQANLTVVTPPAAIFGPLFANAPAVDMPRETLPDPKAEAQARRRYELILPILLYAEDPARFQSLQLHDGTPVRSKSHFILYIAQTQGLGVSTIKFWIKAYRDGGLAALADKERRDKGRSRWANGGAVNAELAELAAYAHIRENLSVHMAWEIVESRARLLGLPVPGYSTIRRILENLNPAAVTLSKKGRKSYDEIFAPYLRRSYEMAAGEILVSDHMIHDVLMQNDVFDGCDRKLIRLRFTGLLDMRSRRFTGYAWSQEGSSRSITTVIRHHYAGFGRFRVFYCDNGLDYRKAGRGARGGCWSFEDIPAEAMGVIARLGAEIKFCRPYHPQSKLIERANNTIHQRFDRRWSTYCGPTPEQRPERCEALAARHNKLLTAGRVEESEVPLASEFIRAAIAWIEGEYHRKTKDVEGMSSLTPLEAWDTFRWSDDSGPVDPAVLVPLLQEREQRVIQNGRIKHGSRFYIAADAGSALQLHDRCGDKAMVLYDPLDDEWLAAADEAGRIFAYLKPETLLRQSDDEETRAAIAASMQQRSRLFRQTSEQLKDLDRRVLSTGYVPQNDQMLQIGRLASIDIDEVVVHRPRKSKRLRSGKPATPMTRAEVARMLLEE